MKNWQQITFLFSLLLITQSITAQRGMGQMSPEERVKKQTEMMKERLTLSAAQTERVEGVLTTTAEKMKDARDAADGDWSSMRETMKTIRTEQNAEMKKYLTADQYTAYEKIQEEEIERRRNRKKNGKGKKKKKQTEEEKS